MELSDQFSVGAQPSEVWRLFWDLPRVARCLPGCESITSTGPDAYRARLAQRVGPFKVAFDLDLAVEEAVEMERVVVSGGGQDRMGNRLKLNRLSLELEEAPGGGNAGQVRPRLRADGADGDVGQLRRQAQGGGDAPRVQRTHSPPSWARSNRYGRKRPARVAGVRRGDGRVDPRRGRRPASRTRRHRRPVPVGDGEPRAPVRAHQGARGRPAPRRQRPDLPAPRAAHARPTHDAHAPRVRARVARQDPRDGAAPARAGGGRPRAGEPRRRRARGRNAVSPPRCGTRTTAGASWALAASSSPETRTPGG